MILRQASQADARLEAVVTWECAECNVEDSGGRAALRDAKGFGPTVLVVGVEVIVRRDYAIAVVGVSHGDGNGPGDGWVMREVLIGLPRDIVCGVADVEDAGEQQRQVATACADDEIGSR